MFTTGSDHLFLFLFILVLIHFTMLNSIFKITRLILPPVVGSQLGYYPLLSSGVDIFHHAKFQLYIYENPRGRWELTPGKLTSLSFYGGVMGSTRLLSSDTLLVSVCFIMLNLIVLSSERSRGISSPFLWLGPTGLFQYTDLCNHSCVYHISLYQTSTLHL